MHKRKKEYEQEERERKKYRISAVASRRIGMRIVRRRNDDVDVEGRGLEWIFSSGGCLGQTTSAICSRCLGNVRDATTLMTAKSCEGGEKKGHLNYNSFLKRGLGLASTRDEEKKAESNCTLHC